MDVEEVLEFADHLVFAMTGKHLDNLQKAILCGAWDNKTYKDIAKHHHRSEQYVKEIGFKLWRLLSDVLGEELNKSNFRAALERRWRFSQFLPFWKAFVEHNNMYPETLHPSEQSPHQQLDNDISDAYKLIKVLSIYPESTKITYQDLDEAPDILPFYGRTDELATLEKWIIQERSRLVAIFGMSGIGKTALAVQFVKQIQDKFDYVIWRSLRFSPSLTTLQINLLQFLCQANPDSSFNKERECELLPNLEKGLNIIKSLKNNRCLVILDDLQMIFCDGELAGKYQTGYEDYSIFFRQIGELSHNSCLLLISRDKPREIVALEGEKRHCKSLQIEGLKREQSRNILQSEGLLEENTWEKLIEYYQGNPLWIKIIATLIKDLFSGSISELWQCDPLFLGDTLKNQLNEDINRLSELEKKVILTVAREPEAVSMAKVLDNLKELPSDILDTFQSLIRRSLITKKEQGKITIFTVNPLIRQYLKTQDSQILK
jgi:hypothetical protein